jgi:hypothetical protein
VARVVDFLRPARQVVVAKSLPETVTRHPREELCCPGPENQASEMETGKTASPHPRAGGGMERRQSNGDLLLGVWGGSPRREEDSTQGARVLLARACKDEKEGTGAATGEA